MDRGQVAVDPTARVIVPVPDGATGIERAEAGA
jgi:hypothetical protein